MGQMVGRQRMFKHGPWLRQLVQQMSVHRFFHSFYKHKLQESIFGKSQQSHHIKDMQCLSAGLHVSQVPQIQHSEQEPKTLRPGKSPEEVICPERCVPVYPGPASLSLDSSDRKPFLILSLEVITCSYSLLLREIQRGGRKAAQNCSNSSPIQQSSEC